MSATSSPSQPGCISTGGPTPEEIDSSCRAPVMMLFLGAACWLLLASVFGLIASLKFHSPALLADHAWLTYGRVHPAATNSLIYGFAMPAGFGVLLWLTAHMARQKLYLVSVIIAGIVVWNTGVLAGIIGILCGENAGFEWFEMQRYGKEPLFLASIAIGLGAMFTFHRREQRAMQLPQWFLLAALLWFPWIFSCARLLLDAMPVRGTMQSLVAWWYAANLSNIWLGFVGLAAIFYLVPKITGRPMYSIALGLFTFWTLLFFGSWPAVPGGTPLPSWIPALSTLAGVATVIPFLSVAVNMKNTMCGWKSAGEASPALKFILFGSLAYVVSGLMGAASSVARVSEVTNFTWFLPAQSQLAIYGFFSMVMFGAIYYIVPRVLGAEFCSRKAITAHFVLAGLGIAIYSISLAAGGIKQGLDMNAAKGTMPFIDVLKATLPFLRASTTGDLLMACGHLVFLANLLGIVRTATRSCISSFLALNKTAEVAP